MGWAKRKRSNAKIEGKSLSRVNKRKMERKEGRKERKEGRTDTGKRKIAGCVAQDDRSYKEEGKGEESDNERGGEEKIQ